jgi:hypothetical protein
MRRNKRRMMGGIGAALVLLAAEAVVLSCVLGVLPAGAAPLTDGLAPLRKSEYAFPVRMSAGTVYRGGLVAVSNGLAYAAANNAEYRVVGVAEDTVVNTAGAVRNVTVRQGVYAFANAFTGSGTNAVYALQVSDVGKPAYVVDDQTVGAASNAYVTVAGTVAYVEPDLKWVWVDVAKPWAGGISLQPFSLPTSATGLAPGRLWLYSGAAPTNVVQIVP